MAKQNRFSLQSALKKMVKNTVADDANLQQLLDLRFDAETSIFTAVEYGVQNISNLQRDLSVLKEGEKAKIIYLCHHLGSPDDVGFIDHTMTATRAQYLLKRQIGKKLARQRASNAGGDYLKAHRSWVGDFIDRNIRPVKFMCDQASSETIRDLLTITDAISNKQAKK